MIESRGTNTEGGNNRERGVTRRGFLKLALGVLGTALLEETCTREEEQSQEKERKQDVFLLRTPEAKQGVIREKIMEGVFIELSESKKMLNGNEIIEINIVFSGDKKEMGKNFFNNFTSEVGTESLIKRYFLGIDGNINSFEDNETFRISFRCNFYTSLLNLHLTKKDIINRNFLKLWELISQEILSWYKDNPPNRISINEFKKILKNIIDKVKESLKNEFLNDEYINFFFNNLDPEILVSVTLREILPNPKSEEEYFYNYLFFNIFLNAGGTQFLEGIPALYDNIVSFGPFQFTPLPAEDIGIYYSLYFDDKKFNEKMKEVFKREITFTSNISELNNGMHYIWFIINAFRIFMGILMSLKDEEKKQKFKELLNNKENFVRFVALSHFSPRAVLEIVENSLENNNMNWESLKESRADFKKLAYDYFNDIYRYYNVLKLNLGRD